MGLTIPLYRSIMWFFRILYKMKRMFTKIAALMVGVLALAACSKDDVKSFEGRYSYKISGKVALLPTEYVNASPEQKQMMEAMGLKFTETWVPLYPEQGQMHINIKDKDEDLVIVTFNDIFANVCTATAVVDDEMISFNESEKTAVLTDGTSKIASGFVAYSGSGRKYGNQLLISLEYSGNFVLDGTPMTVVDSVVDCVATEN